MEWIVIFAIVVVFMLWWIRWAIEPVRQYFQHKLDAQDERASDERFAAASRDASAAGEE